MKRVKGSLMLPPMRDHAVAAGCAAVPVWIKGAVQYTLYSTVSFEMVDAGVRVRSVERTDQGKY